MRTIFIFTLFLTNTLLLSAQNFCGVISLTISKDSKTAPASMYVCDGNLLIRYNLEANGQANSVDYLVLNSGKKSLKYNIMGNEQGVELSDNDIKSSVQVEKVMRTGEKAQILGYECELVKILGKDGNITEVWITESSPVDYSSIAPYLKDDATAQSIHKLGLKGMPLKSVVKDKNGFELSSFQVTEINPNGVEKTLFVAPKLVVQPNQAR